MKLQTDLFKDKWTVYVARENKGKRGRTKITRIWNEWGDTIDPNDIKIIIKICFEQLCTQKFVDKWINCFTDATLQNSLKSKRIIWFTYIHFQLTNQVQMSLLQLILSNQRRNYINSLQLLSEDRNRENGSWFIYEASITKTGHRYYQKRCLLLTLMQKFSTKC